ncbi:hypothetical protein Ahy_B02g057710 isoform C [Arachis hypogaea]|uniref:Ubiquitin-like protease family profile domain-containing protein n=2 Tax=Arachis hypogaea TaxID=3818 RepID=A0A445ACX3_ARAHY|nr:hypothetical protein Ahy_B02g057710 isoform C [Arachis hypogaea]
MADSSTSSTSSTSQNASKPRKRSQFRAKIKVQKIEIVVRNLHQNNIKLYVKNLKRKRSKYTQHKMAARNQTKDLKCATHLLSDKFRNMAEEKKAIVRDLGFGGLMHVPPLRVDHQLLRELANNFKLGENKLKTGYGSFQITPKTIGDALGINATGNLFPEKVEYKQLYKQLSDDDKIIYRRFQGKTLKSLTDEMMEIGVGSEEERLMFKRIFILYIQMAFLLPTTINKISPVHLAPIFKMDGISERNWGAHVLTFLIKGITDYQDKKKKAIDGCLFALMIIYFHLSENKGKKKAERPPKPWIANWTKEKLVERMTAEKEETLGIVKMAETRAREKMKEKEKKEKTQEIKKTKKRKASPTSSSETETATDSDTTTSESESQQDSEDSARKHPIKKGKKMDSRKRKQRQEEPDSDSESESEQSDESEESSPAEKEKEKKKTKTTPKKTQPKKKKVLVEDSPPKEDQYFDGETYEISSDELDEWLGQNVDKSAAEGENQPDLRSTEGRYVSSETIPAVNLGTDAPSSQGNTEQSSVNQPSQSMLSPSDSNMMVVREQTPSEALAIVPIQVFVPASQTTTETDFEPTPMLQIEGTTETTPETPKQLQETTPTVPPAPTKVHPDAEDAAALLMMARTASYVPKTDPGVPSFSLGLTDSSQEGASTQETEMEKSPEAANLIEQLDSLVQRIASSATKGKNTSPQIQRETGGESSAKFETPRGLYQITDDMKQKCYIWGTRLKEDADGNTNEYEEMCTLIGQGEYILMRMHLASLQAKSDIESQIVSAVCLILNNKNEKRFQEQIYCLPPDIVCMALSDHPNGEFVSPKTKKEFRVEAYPSFIPFIDRKKLTSHPYIFAPVCYAGHWWLWLINTRKRKCQILDPLHKIAPTDERKTINKFTGYVFSRLITYAGGKPLQKGEREKEIKSPYVKISGQKTSYDCAVYVMKWMEIIEPENIKKGKYQWDNWPQEEVDHYRVEYASRILFSEMNTQRDQAIRESSAIRLSKPSSILLSPFCQINSTDIESG